MAYTEGPRCIKAGPQSRDILLYTYFCREVGLSNALLPLRLLFVVSAQHDQLLCLRTPQAVRGEPGKKPTLHVWIPFFTAGSGKAGSTSGRIRAEAVHSSSWVSTSHSPRTREEAEGSVQTDMQC